MGMDWYFVGYIMMYDGEKWWPIFHFNSDTGCTNGWIFQKSETTLNHVGDIMMIL
jgi:hypothetical protein